MSKQILLRVDDDLLQAIEAKAGSEGLSKQQWLIRLAMQATGLISTPPVITDISTDISELEVKLETSLSAKLKNLVEEVVYSKLNLPTREELEQIAKDSYEYYQSNPLYHQLTNLEREVEKLKEEIRGEKYQPLAPSPTSKPKTTNPLEGISGTDLLKLGKEKGLTVPPGISTLTNWFKPDDPKPPQAGTKYYRFYCWISENYEKGEDKKFYPLSPELTLELQNLLAGCLDKTDYNIREVVRILTKVGYPYKFIADYLNEKNYPCSEGEKWTPKLVGNIYGG